MEAMEVAGVEIERGVVALALCELESASCEYDCAVGYFQRGRLVRDRQNALEAGDLDIQRAGSDFAIDN